MGTLLKPAHPLVSLRRLRVVLPLPFAVAALLAISGCAQDPVRPRVDPLQVGLRLIDIPLAWSHDGEWIAFRRMLASSYGPPGMYVVHRSGSTVRHVYSPAGLFFPREASFSPDGRFIAAVDPARQLFIIDLETLVAQRPFHFTGEVYWPDWSPDGQNILLALAHDNLAPPESTGLSMFEPATGRLRQIQSSQQRVLGEYARWSPDGTQIAFVQNLGGEGQAISVMNADGSDHRFVIRPQSLKFYSNIDWYSRGPGSAPQILFWRSQHPGAGPYLIYPDGTGEMPFWHAIRSEGYLSPTGKEFVRPHLDPEFKNRVLYVGLVDDVTDVVLRQLTHYELPSTTLSVGEEVPYGTGRK